MVGGLPDRMCPRGTHNAIRCGEADLPGIGTFDRVAPPRTRACCRDHGAVVCGASIKLEYEAQGVVDRHDFIVLEPPDELAETLMSNGGCLLDEDLRVVTVDRDRRAKDPRRRRT
jgi:hypothetical protein